MFHISHPGMVRESLFVDGGQVAVMGHFKAIRRHYWLLFFDTHSLSCHNFQIWFSILRLSSLCRFVFLDQCYSPELLVGNPNFPGTELGFEGYCLTPRPGSYGLPFVQELGHGNSSSSTAAPPPPSQFLQQSTPKGWGISGAGGSAVGEALKSAFILMQRL